MTEERLVRAELLEKAGDEDFLRAVAEAVLQLLMETDVEGVIGAGRYERSGERSTWRDGYRDRTLDTRLAYKEGEPPVETAATRIFAMLTAATSMHLKAREREEPFGPLMSSCDRRTAIPADFRGEPVKLLADMAARSVNPLLKARLADMCWLLERKRGALAAVAVAAYVETIEAVELGTLKFQYAHNDGASPRATSTT